MAARGEGGGVGAPMRQVLVTRAQDDAGELCARLSAMGFVPVAAPLLTIAPRRLSVPAGVQAVLISSRHAVPTLPPGHRLLAVGDATAACAQAAGFGRVHSAGGDAPALAALAGRLLDPAQGPLLLATGAGQGHGLAADLRARGFAVLRRVAYAARPAARFPAQASLALRSGRLHAAIFLSAETAATFMRLLPPADAPLLAPVTALAIGASTADALDALPWLRICRASHPTLDGVLALL